MSTMVERWAIPSVLLLAMTLQVVLVEGCRSIELGEVSPLAGTWRGVSDYPGTTFVGTFVFDYFGDLRRLEAIGGKWPLRLTFDGQPHRDSAGDEYTAHATTTVSGNVFLVKATVEYTDGNREGLTVIRVEGRVQYGSMAGTVEVDFPGRDHFVEGFRASRS